MSVTKFGRGECGELTSKAMVEAIRRSIPARVVLCSQEKGTTQHSHAFIVFDPDIDQITAERNPLEALSRSRKGILVDPFFNLVCPAANILGTSFETYLRNNRIDTIHVTQDVPSFNQSAMAGLEENVNKIHKLAVIQLKDPKWVSPERNQIKETFLIDARKAELARLFPAITWKGEKNRTLWRRTDLEEGQQLCDAINRHFNLNLKPQQVKAKPGSYVVAIDREALLSMRVCL